MKEQRLFQKLLTATLMEIRARRPSYSMRAFALRAGLSSSALSEIFSGKRKVSRANAEKVMRRLGIEPGRVSSILDLFPEKPRRKNASLPKNFKYTKLEAEQYRAISDWQHFAIHSLSQTEGFMPDPHWIGGRLNIRSSVAKAALIRLQELGMLDESGRLPSCASLPQYTTSDGVVEHALRKAHAQHLSLARESLNRDSLSDRDFTAITMAVDPELLPEAKRMIREFRDRLCVFLESGRKKEVYALNVQLIPLTRVRRADSLEGE